jgi:hypothetical protein
VLVPREPTEDMLKAALPFHWFTRLGKELADNYRRMLAAVPKPDPAQSASSSDAMALSASELDDFTRRLIERQVPFPPEIAMLIREHWDELFDDEPDSAQSADTPSELCPNCVSPHKCNGPHIGDAPPTGYEDADTPSDTAQDGEESDVLYEALQKAIKALDIVGNCKSARVVEVAQDRMKFLEGRVRELSAARPQPARG